MNTSSSMTKFTWLVKREYWEYRGGFLWTPAIIAMAFLGIFCVALFIAEVTAHRNGVNLNGIQLGELSKMMTPEQIAKMSAGVDVGLLGLCFPIGIGLFFVLFFYSLGALYNDRSDRSVLFWKSLPISDSGTVLSKVAAAGLIAPLFAVAAMIALQLGFLILMTIYAALHGINALPILWSPLHLLALWLKLIVLIPINALWALPSIGWLMLCSSFARSKPFLWAVMLPVIAGVISSSIHLMQSLTLPSGWFWRHVVGRVLLSLFPGTWLSDAMTENGFNKSSIGMIVDGPSSVDATSSPDLLNWHTIFSALSLPELWIGVAAGIAMIVAAIYFRRKRTEAYA